MTLTSLLMFSPELNLERELCNTYYLLTLELKQNLIIYRQVRKELKEWTCKKKMLVKRNPLKKNKAEAYYLHM